MATRSIEELQRLQAEADEQSDLAGYRVGALETHDSAVDRLTWRLSQAHAMLVMINGEGLKPFQVLNDNLQMDYLSAIDQLVSAARVDGALAIAGAKSENRGAP